MENEIDPLLNRDDELHAENNLLKLKLGLEYGMEMTEVSPLSPDVENHWLKSVYAWESAYKNAKRVKLYDYIGRPAFPKWDSLTPEQVSRELERIHTIMENNSVHLSSICKYDDTTIYKFITEELFEHEMDDMRVLGMTCHFTYEEFHPNHDYEIRERAADFVRKIFRKQWNQEYDGIILSDKIFFSGATYDRKGISTIVSTFQDAHSSLRLHKFDTHDVVIEPDYVKASVIADLSAMGKMKDGEKVRYIGACSFKLEREYDYWQISDFSIPGFGNR